MSTAGVVPEPNHPVLHFEPSSLIALNSSANLSFQDPATPTGRGDVAAAGARGGATAGAGAGAVVRAGAGAVVV